MRSAVITRQITADLMHGTIPHSTMNDSTPYRGKKRIRLHIIIIGLGNRVVGYSTLAPSL